MRIGGLFGSDTCFLNLKINKGKISFCLSQQYGRASPTLPLCNGLPILNFTSLEPNMRRRSSQSSLKDTQESTVPLADLQKETCFVLTVPPVNNAHVTPRKRTEEKKMCTMQVTECNAQTSYCTVNLKYSIFYLMCSHWFDYSLHYEDLRKTIASVKFRPGALRLASLSLNSAVAEPVAASFSGFGDCWVKLSCVFRASLHPAFRQEMEHR